MSDKRSRTKLSVEDKMAMFAYKDEHPDASFATIANTFTEKLNKKIDRTSDKYKKKKTTSDN